MVINFTDDMLKKAVIKADIYEIETLPADDEIEYEFSNEFKRKIKKLIRQNKTRSQVEAMAFLRMRVVVFVAAIIILLVSAMSVSAMRAAVFEFITEVNEKFTHIMKADHPRMQPMDLPYMNQPIYRKALNWSIKTPTALFCWNMKKKMILYPTANSALKTFLAT